MAQEEKLVISEKLTKPSSIAPMLFVGLGGCGCSMVARVAEHLRRLPDFQERYKGLIKFALVDTNVNDLERYRAIADDSFLISDFEKEEYANLASGKMFLEPDDYFTQWVPPSYRFRAGDTAGAGQIRIEARLGVYYQMKHKDFVPRFRRLLDSLKSHEQGHRRLDTPEIRIVVCYSVAGGTGSGSHLPIAYMLRDLGRQVGKPSMIGVAVLPSVFEDKTGVNKDGTYANGYAALKETEHLMKLGSPDSAFFPENGITFHYDPSDESKRIAHDKPFEFLYVVDKPESFTVSEPVKAAADGLYLQFFSPLFGRQAGDYDNYTQHQRFLVPHDFEGKGIQGFTSFYGTFGAAVLHVPVDGLVEYCAHATALNLMKSNFLGDIPGDVAYESLRTNPAVYNEVALRPGEIPVPEEDFEKKEKTLREDFKNALFMKRLTLLAACELAAGHEDGKHLTAFRHGYEPGYVPKGDGSVTVENSRRLNDVKQLAENKWAYSIGGMVLPALSAAPGGGLPGLLKAARDKLESYCEENIPTAEANSGLHELKTKAEDTARLAYGQALRILEKGVENAIPKMPGFGQLLELGFMKKDAGDIGLVAQRFAALSLIAHLPANPTASSSSDKEDSGSTDSGEMKFKKKEEAQAKLSACLNDEQAKYEALISKEFYKKVEEFKDKLKDFVKNLRVMEDGYPHVEREKGRYREELRKKGDLSTNRYILDSEAFQIESGRRMWDFYFYDCVAAIPELDSGDKNVMSMLAGTVADITLAGGEGDSSTLERIYRSLYQYSHRIITAAVAGDSRSPDAARRNGLTLPDALEKEFDYWTLYRSNMEAIEAKGEQEVRALISKYRIQQRQKMSLKKDAEEDRTFEKLKKDYLRDKVMRLVKERADLLCVYDESRDLQGGVRPDRVFMAAVSDKILNPMMEDILIGAGLHQPAWVTDWHSVHEIIVYRAVLNIPLYVFGRMEEMKNCYHTFRNLAKRPKALHIDRNWEDTLPDLDPDTSQENHRQSIIREQVVNFAALLTTAHPLANKTVSKGQKPLSCIFRRDGYYLLASPTRSPDRDPNGQDDENGTVRLGASMGEAIQKLPEVLESDVVGYFQYQQLLRSVREGLAPNVLIQVADLPKQWRENHDKLRNQYGSVPTDIQGKQLKDYADSYKRLREALEQLLEKLRNRQIELQTVGEDVSANTGTLSNDKARSNLHQCIDILTNFSAGWAAMENPDKSRTLPGAFDGIFEPLDEATLQGKLKQLRSGEVCYRGEEV